MKKDDADNFFAFSGKNSKEKETIVEDVKDEEDFLEEDFEEESPLHNEAEEESENEETDEERETEYSKSDPKGKRFEHWQSVANREQNARKQLEAKLAELKAVAPIAEFLRTNPKALDSIEEYAKKSASAKAEPTIEKPTRPVKPSNFSYMEAEENPDGDSGKYLRNLEAYQERVTDYYAQRDEQREKTISEVYQSKLQQEHQAEKMRNLSVTLQDEYEMSVADANAFITEMNSPGTVELNSLVDYWKFKHSDKKSRTDNSSEKAQNLRDRARTKLEAKAPAIGNGGSGTADTSKMFMDDLRRTGKNLFEFSKR